MISAVKGMNDLFGKRAMRWGRMEEDIRRIVEAANFTEFRTPILEEITLFKRGVGETTDVVQKEMYDFLDKKGRHVAMRPEGTASVVRAFIEHGIAMNEPMPFKLYYIGPFFRYERPQKGRYRQFHQLGIEILGDETPQMDAEMIFTACRVLDHFKIDYEVHVNSIGCKECRPAYREKLVEYFSSKKEHLCDDCQKRIDTNPLRLLDCKTCNPKAKYQDIPVMTDNLCGSCDTHFKQLKDALKIFHVNGIIDPFIVRGLDYYTRTAFEIVANTGGTQNAVAGGGRYDNLVSDIGGPDTPATGFAMGLERLFDLIPEDFYSEPLLSAGYALCDEAVDDLVHFAKHMSHHPVKFFAEYKPRKFKKALQKADKSGATFMFIIGEDEAKDKKILMKNLKTGEQKIFGQHEVILIVNELMNYESMSYL
ncbi:MAG TPA: histidine--tRNA ligase [bacterium]|nr:histidine--tRNA ligase [bacterium]